MIDKLPFSRRTHGSQWIQDDFPDSARIGLIHLLYDLVDRNYVDGWINIDRELRRISREEPVKYDRQKGTSIESACTSAEKLLKEIEWNKIFDFCERLYSNLANEVSDWNGQLIRDREEAQIYIGDELQRIFLEENLAFSFNEDGQVQRRGRKHTAKQISKAEDALGDPKLNNSREHFRKAKHYFHNPNSPDYENAVKEAVCAVEAASRSLFPDTKGKTLDEVIKKIQGSGDGQLPKPIANSITCLYAYRNAGDGISHGGSNGGKVTQVIAEYTLAVAASQIILLHAFASIPKTDLPF